jgi:hypothetical protein
MANAHDSTSMEISPAAAAIIASTAKEVAEQQAMNEALEAQIQDGVQELLRVSGTCPPCLNKSCLLYRITCILSACTHVQLTAPADTERTAPHPQLAAGACAARASQAVAA